MRMTQSDWQEVGDALKEDNPISKGSAGAIGGALGGFAGGATGHYLDQALDGTPLEGTGPFIGSLIGFFIGTAIEKKIRE